MNSDEKTILEELLEKSQPPELLSGAIEPIRADLLGIILSMEIIEAESYITLFNSFLQRQGDISDINRLLVLTLAVKNISDIPVFFPYLDVKTGEVYFTTTSGSADIDYIIHNRKGKYIGMDIDCLHELYIHYNAELKSKNPKDSDDEKLLFRFIRDVFVPILNNTSLKNTRISIKEDGEILHVGINSETESTEMSITEFINLFRRQSSQSSN